MSINLGLLYAQVGADTSGLRKAERESNRLTANIQRDLDKTAKSANMLKGAFAALGVGLSFKGMLDATIKQQQAVAQLEAALTSTGHAMGYTSQQLQSMAAEFQNLSTYGDEAIISAQARLLSYTGIVGSNFPRALKSVLDQSARLNMSLEQSAETIGRALESPSKAAAALARQGFGAAFTDQVRGTIDALVEAGREAEAQIMILEILEESYGGAAEAARNTLGGALDGLKNAFGDLLEAPGGMQLTVFQELGPAGAVQGST